MNRVYDRLTADLASLPESQQPLIELCISTLTTLAVREVSKRIHSQAATHPEVKAFRWTRYTRRSPDQIEFSLRFDVLSPHPSIRLPQSDT